MLEQLSIRDLVIVDRLELEFHPGMTALTGETGAGKSILLDALGLILGNKADASMIRVGCERGEVSASFDLTHCPEALDWLKDQALDEGEGCLVRRVLVRAGRSRAFVNGQAASTAQLRALGDLLVDLHGQHEHQSLLRAPAQRQLLDDFAGHSDPGHSELLVAVASSHRRYTELDRRFKALAAAQADRAARLELLRFQVEELQALNLAEAEVEHLDAEQHRLGHLDDLRARLGTLVELLYDGEGALRDQLGHAARELSSAMTIDARLRDSQEMVSAALVQVEEAASSLRQYLDGLEMDPERLSVVEERLGRVHDLARKYRVEPVLLRQELAARETELDSLERADESLEQLAGEREALRATLLDQARALGASREQAAQRLSETVTQAMQGLGMSGGRFAIRIESLNEEALSASGLNRIAFEVSANPGQPLQTLSKVASGGELSRISLAIQVATAEIGRIPCLIFDEVDVGIGGGVAEIVGRLLRRLGGNRQVLCVTHLPQVAAQARQQLRVIKSIEDGKTRTRVHLLDDPERDEEIARMLGGTEITDTTRAHAREMLEKGHSADQGAAC